MFCDLPRSLYLLLPLSSISRKQKIGKQHVAKFFPTARAANNYFTIVNQNSRANCLSDRIEPIINCDYRLIDR